MNALKTAVTAAVVAAGLSATAGALAANDIFLKLSTIKGESNDATHKGEVEVLSWSWGVSNTTSANSGTGGGAGKVAIHDISITKKIDAASPSLLLATSTGQRIPLVNLVVRKAGEKPLEYLKIKLEDVFVSSVSSSGSNGADSAMESVTLTFSKVTYEYTATNRDGTPGQTVRYGWDVKSNMKL